MSRIHEALKRAEQERMAGQATQKVEERIAVNTVIETTVPPSDIPVVPILQTAAAPRSNGTPVNDDLQFDEIWAKCSKPHWKPNPDLLVFRKSGPFSTGTEQFRTLRSRLYRIRENQPLQSILISSAIPAEGKTLVATNLAYALVRQQGCRVLLIDADIRSPRVHTMLGAPQTPGLADYLQGGASELEVIQRGEDEGFCMVPAGNNVTHPSELISSDRMKHFLERAKSVFDWVIVDSPPALPVADASVLGRLCDGVLFVVRANSTPSETAQKACKELRDTHILGVVLNTVDETSEYGAYYSGDGYGMTSAQYLK
jgi:capsular exopolysaccharide synthesis family protein